MKKTIFLVFFMIGNTVLLLAQKELNIQRLNTINDSIFSLNNLPQKSKTTYLQLITLEQEKNKLYAVGLKKLKDSLNFSAFNAKEAIKKAETNYLQQKYKGSIFQMLLVVFLPLSLFFMYLYFNLKMDIKKQTQEELDLKSKEKQALASIGQMKDELVKYKASFSQFSTHIETLQQQNSTLKGELSLAKVENTTLSADIFEKNKENITLNEELASTNQRLKNTMTELQAIKEKRAKTLDTLQQLINDK